MSRIALNGNASGTGTVTIASPNTNSDRTVTLPDATGTLVLSGDVASFSTLTVNSNNISAVNSLGFRNRIINGNMVIDQRNAGASVTVGATGSLYTLDRWFVQSIAASKFSVQQNAGSVTPPTGFTKYLGITSLAATSSASGDYYALNQAVEGFNVADLAWGTASAQSITVSFQIRSSLTGTFSGSIANSGAARSYPFTFTISSANTWETKTVTISGDTSGTWLTDNGIGLYLRFDLGCGSTFKSTAGSWQAGNFYGATGATSVVGTNGATFYITGVQLEAGSVASPFERRDYGRELMICQRYYCKNTGAVDGGGTSFATVSRDIIVGVKINFMTEMRSAPTLSMLGTTGRSGGDADGQEISTIGFSWGRKKTGTGSADVYAFANGGFEVSSEL
jgi:hypothetical protein